MLPIILQSTVEGRDMNEIAATVHQSVGEVSDRKRFLGCRLHVYFWIFHKEGQCLALGVEHEIVGADLAVGAPLLQREEAEAVAMTAVFVDESGGLTGSTRSGENGNLHIL